MVYEITHMAFGNVCCLKLQFKVIGVEIMVIGDNFVRSYYQNITGQVAQIPNHNATDIN
jgi:hypothetical protein